MDPVRGHVLPNGIRLVGVPRCGSSLAAVLLHIQVGSADEDPAEEGVAHVLEHLVARCAMDGGRVGDGALITARTGRERTLYSVVVRRAAVLRAVATLGAAFRMSHVPPAVLDAELAAIREERRERANDPAWHLQESLLGVLWPGTRCAHPVLGSPEAIDALTPQQISDFHAAWYRPGNATLVVAADHLNDFLPAIVQAASTWSTSRTPAIRPPGHPGDRMAPMADSLAGSLAERPGGGTAVAARGSVFGFAFAERSPGSAASMLACDVMQAANGLTVRTLPLRGWLCVWVMLTASGAAVARHSVVTALIAAGRRLAGPDGPGWLHTDVLIPRLRAEGDVERAALRGADQSPVICEDALLGCSAGHVAGVLAEWRRRFGLAPIGMGGGEEGT